MLDATPMAPIAVTATIASAKVFWSKYSAMGWSQSVGFGLMGCEAVPVSASLAMVGVGCLLWVVGVS
jgi:hypothetical protein